ncbi:hypothetical protein Lpp125_11496, partial [Lacticaseibacillus paracasei subsp. paracasei Lpp125]|uniref:distal tail protein Dit n=1 Tax=Lacticaseibacillus paracasei TaxID=1597 RepID=UPI0003437B9E
MYDFRETTPFTGSDDNQRPAEAMLIDGQYIEDLIPGYSTLQVSGRELLSQSIEKQTIGKSDGEFIQYARNPSREIVVGYRLAASNNLSFRQAFYKLNSILHGDSHQVSFNDDPSKYWIATFSDIDDVPKGRNAITSSFTLFVPDGIAHSVATKTADNKDPKWNGSPLNLLTGTAQQVLTIDAGANNYAYNKSLYNNLDSTKTYTFSADVDLISGSPTQIRVGSHNGSGTKTVDADIVNGHIAGTFTPLATDYKTLILYAGVPGSTAGNKINFSKIKLEIGTTASPWSPNPADPEYYSDTITVHNGGTYPVEPVIEATINGDDGVLTAINDQGSVLQFGSPDDTDGFVKQKSERVYHIDFNQTPTGVTLNKGVTAFPYYEHGNNANVQSGPFGYANGIAYPSTERTASNYWNGPSM